MPKRKSPTTATDTTIAEASQSQSTTHKVIKSTKCKSLSSKATLAYEIGCDDNGDPQLRITSNSGGGFFSAEWVPLEQIRKALSKHQPGIPITATAIWPLFRGKSVNTPSFVMAVLLSEGLLQRHKDHKRNLELVETSKFNARMSALARGKPTMVSASSKAPRAESAGKLKTTPPRKPKRSAAKK